MQSSTVKLVLEKCGTEIEDDEVLEEIPNEILMLLSDEEEYIPAGPTSTPLKPPESLEEQHNTVTTDPLNSFQPTGSASNTQV